MYVDFNKVDLSFSKTFSNRMVCASEIEQFWIYSGLTVSVKQSTQMTHANDRPPRLLFPAIIKITNQN